MLYTEIDLYINDEFYKKVDIVDGSAKAEVAGKNNVEIISWKFGEIMVAKYYEKVKVPKGSVLTLTLGIDEKYVQS